MFHTYVTASSGRQIDFNRAEPLMDKDLLEAAIEAGGLAGFDFVHARREGSRIKVDARVQDVWHIYCARHIDRHGDPFVPDVSLTWDT